MVIHQRSKLMIWSDLSFQFEACERLINVSEIFLSFLFESNILLEEWILLLQRVSKVRGLLHHFGRIILLVLVPLGIEFRKLLPLSEGRNLE